MSIILAIDLKNGRVVKAFAGLRINYRPLVINSIDYSDPIFLIRKISKKLRLKKIYIADLDAIQNLGSNSSLISNILKSFKNINFLIDCGFSYPMSVRNFENILKKKKISNYTIVLGTESMRKYNLNCFRSNNRLIISLDLIDKNSKWIDFLKLSKFRLDIIFMFLRNVGGRGVNVKKVRYLMKSLPKNNYFYAGGVKYFSDIKCLGNLGVESVIVSTLVHQKYLAK